MKNRRKCEIIFYLNQAKRIMGLCKVLVAAASQLLSFFLLLLLGFPQASYFRLIRWFDLISPSRRRFYGSAGCKSTRRPTVVDATARTRRCAAAEKSESSGRAAGSQWKQEEQQRRIIFDKSSEGTIITSVSL